MAFAPDPLVMVAGPGSQSAATYSSAESKLCRQYLGRSAVIGWLLPLALPQRDKKNKKTALPQSDIHQDAPTQLS
jgi:hypothetical protein